VFERFTDRSRYAMALANAYAHRTGYLTIQPRHILMGLLTENAGVGVHALRKLNCSLTAMAETLGAKIEEKPATGVSKLPPAPMSKWIIGHTISEARAFGHNYCGTEHMILALARCAAPDVEAVFSRAGVTYSMLRQAVWEMLEGQGDVAAPPEPLPPPGDG
jgi:ATP-dependent Clp protease ATP-binding subunit ClpA